MLADVDLGDLLWSMLIVFFMVQYLIVLFVVIVDVFRSGDLSGLKKTIWLLCLLFVPIITLIVYLITRGDAIGERNLEHAKGAAYVRDLPPPVGGPATELQKAKSLLDSGAIDVAEYERLKASILA